MKWSSGVAITAVTRVQVLVSLDATRHGPHPSPPRLHSCSDAVACTEQEELLKPAGTAVAVALTPHPRTPPFSPPKPSDDAMCWALGLDRDDKTTMGSAGSWESKSTKVAGCS